MGRLLDIARKTRGTLRPSAAPAEASRKDSPPNRLPPFRPASVPAEPLYDRVAADVVNLIAHAGRPVSHSAILKTLAATRRDKASVRQAIACCQKQGWIEHDLITGYVLPRA